MTDWVNRENPREKLMHSGSSSLSNAELIAILIGTGTSGKSALEVAKLILSENKGQLSQLSRRSVEELKTLKGLGEAKATKIVAAIELGKRKTVERVQRRGAIHCSADAFAFLSEHLSDLIHEEFWLICMNKGNVVQAKYQIGKGSESQTPAQIKLILRYALVNTSSSLILAHNHPSGNLSPSQADKILTQKVVCAAQMMDIQVLDHIIVAGNHYFSFADQGLIKGDL